MPLLELHASDGVEVAWALAVPRDRAWRCLTDPELIGQWLGRLVDGTVQAGAEFTVDHGDGYCCGSTVATWTAPRELAFTWEFPDEPVSQVAVELEDTSDGCILRLAHAGLGDLVQSYADGWCTHLSYFEGAALGTPLPPAMFWPLHATFAAFISRA